MPTFMERKRDELRARGIDPQRLPPGQYVTERFPVLHLGPVPEYPPSLEGWSLTVAGDAVERPRAYGWEELRSLPTHELRADIHCVTKWSRLDVVWRGVRLLDVLDGCGLHPDVATLVACGEHGYTASLPWHEIVDHDALLAWEVDGAALAPEHGSPLRLVVPHLYFWKSVKWLRRLELWTAERAGFWEARGYHPHGDPFTEERYWGDAAAATTPPADVTAVGLSRPLRALLERALATATGSIVDDIGVLRDAVLVVLQRLLALPAGTWPDAVEAAAARAEWDRWRRGGLLAATQPDHDATPETTRDLVAELAEELLAVGDLVPGGWEGEQRQASTRTPEWLEGKRRRELVFSLERVVELVDARDRGGLEHLATGIAGLDHEGEFAAVVALLRTAAADIAGSGAIRADTRDELAAALAGTPFVASVQQLAAADDRGATR